MKKNLFVFLTITSCFFLVLACNKSNETKIGVDLTKNQKMMLEHFKSANLNPNDIDFNAVKSSNLGNENLYILTANLKSNTSKKYVLKVD